MHQGQKFQCQECDIEFTRKSSLAIHLKSVHTGQKVQHPESDYETTRKNIVAIHQKSVHRGEKSQCTRKRLKAGKRKDQTKEAEIQKKINDFFDGFI